jgi:hypothetical protein
MMRTSVASFVGSESISSRGGIMEYGIVSLVKYHGVASEHRRVSRSLIQCRKARHKFPTNSYVANTIRKPNRGMSLQSITL